MKEFFTANEQLLTGIGFVFVIPLFFLVFYLLIHVFFLVFYLLIHVLHLFKDNWSKFIEFFWKKDI